MRLWRLAGVERPAGTVDLRGLIGADNLREITAMVFATRTFAGAPKIVDGVTRGGRERAEQIIDEWLKKTGTQAQKDEGYGLSALYELEETLLKEVFHYNRKEGDTVVEAITKKAGVSEGAGKTILDSLEESGNDISKTEKDIDTAIKQFISDANHNRQNQMRALHERGSYWVDDQGNVHHIPANC